MKIYNDYLDIPELVDLPVKDARNVWNEFRIKDVSPFWVRLCFSATLVVILEELLHAFVTPSETRGALKIAAFIFGVSVAQWLTLQYQIKRFRSQQHADFIQNK